MAFAVVAFLLGYGAWIVLRKSLIWIVTLLPSGVFADDIVIAALGDSLTQGFGLPQQEGFVRQLQTWLDGNGVEARLINAGVSGDTTAGGLSRVEWTLTPEVDAMIVALGGNDLLRGLDPGVSRANLEGILQIAQRARVEVLLVGLDAPGNFGPDYKESFDAIFPDLASQYDVLLAENFFEGLGGSEADPATIRGFMQPDGIHPNAEGVARIVDALGPKVIELVLQVED